MSDQQRVIRVDIHSSSDWGWWINLRDFEEAVSSARSEVPAGRTLKGKISISGSHGDEDLLVELWYDRIETPEEAYRREQREDLDAKQREDSERRMLAALKAKYEST